VGETITAIHATSEDAKSSLAEMSGSTVPVTSSARTARVQIVRLLDKSRELLSALGTSEDAASHGGTPAREAVTIRVGGEPRNSVQDNVENDPEPAEKSLAEGVLLIEGLKPGAHLES
jgi:hypothetical protein